jgi:hypothetical protein
MAKKLNASGFSSQHINIILWSAAAPVNIFSFITGAPPGGITGGAPAKNALTDAAASAKL